MSIATSLSTVQATRYVTPLREGGSLPAIMEADNDGLYVVKFRGAGQGPKALIAELVAGEIGRQLGLPVPEMVLIEVDAALSKAEPDPEIQDLLRASAGLNIGIDFLPGALAFSPHTAQPVDPDFAARVVWFDAFTMNVDRTPRNPNLLEWHGAPWLIDHGASLYVHHASDDIRQRAGAPFPQIADHILLPLAGGIEQAGDDLSRLLPAEEIEQIAGMIPAEWIADRDVGAVRAMYGDFLRSRVALRQGFEEEAERARTRSL